MWICRLVGLHAAASAPECMRRSSQNLDEQQKLMLLILKCYRLYKAKKEQKAPRSMASEAPMVLASSDPCPGAFVFACASPAFLHRSAHILIVAVQLRIVPHTLQNYAYIGTRCAPHSPRDAPRLWLQAGAVELRYEDTTQIRCTRISPCLPSRGCAGAAGRALALHVAAYTMQQLQQLTHTHTHTHTHTAQQPTPARRCRVRSISCDASAPGASANKKTSSAPIGLSGRGLLQVEGALL